MNKSNFDFLKGVNDFIYTIACAAENNYPDDPNTTLIKMRMFGEATAKHLGMLLDITPCDNQHDLLRELGKIPFVDDSILSIFHKLRRIGNQAVHEYHNDLDDAQMCLRLGFRLSVWYYRLVTKDYDFALPVFFLPERGGESLSSGSFGTQAATGATGKRKSTKPGRDKCSAAKNDCAEWLYCHSRRQTA